MLETANDEKKAKREARKLFEDARVAAEIGDYRALRRLDRRVIELSPSSDVGRQAIAELDTLRLDRMALAVGIGTALIYALAWALSVA